MLMLPDVSHQLVGVSSPAAPDLVDVCVLPPHPLLMPCRNTSALAPAVWLTVGSLAGDGMALQLKLKRLDKPSERDKVQGLWYPYVPVAGALSVRDGFLD